MIKAKTKQDTQIRLTARAVAVSLCLAVLLWSTALGASAGEAYDFPEGSSPVNVSINGEQVLRGEAAIINSTTYVPLRSFSELMGADSISWNAKTSTATVIKGELEIHVTGGALYIGANGRYFFTVQRILNINGRLFVPVRPLAKAFSSEVDWDGDTRTVLITTTGKPLSAGSTYYSSDDLYWLARIIYAEAGGESLIGQIAVGNVVMNRKDSKQYPNTVYGVIFDRNGGTQFSPVSMGTIYNTPSQTSIIAAKICLEGYSVDNKILFFMNPRIATSNWISKNRPFAFTIGRHDFYY